MLDLLPGREWDRHTWWFYWRSYWRAADWEAAAPEARLELLGPPGRALDAGCGTGRNSLALAQMGWQVTALELHPLAYLRAKTRLAGRANLRLIWGGASGLGRWVAPGSQDLVLDFLGPASDLEGARLRGYGAAVAGALRPGGAFWIYTFLEPKLLDNFSGFELEALDPPSPAGGWMILRRL